MPSFFSFGNKIVINKNSKSIFVRNDRTVLGNTAAIGSKSFWNGGLNFTSVGTNGRSSYYGTFDQTGLAWEWCDSTSSSKAIRGGDIAGAGGVANKYNADKTSRYSKTISGGDVNSPIFLSVSNKNTGKPSDQDWAGRISSLDNPLGLNNFISVGNTGNPNDATGYGNVNYEYKISKYLLTNNEYCSFLNSVEPSGSNQLYSTQMGNERVGGINRQFIESSGYYVYSVKPSMGNKPAYFLSWNSLARYANWLHNNYGSTETGVYTLASTGIIVKNSGAKYYIPTENEWYKAAYYNGSGGYWNFATQSNETPTPVNANSAGEGSFKNITVSPSITGVGSNFSVDGFPDPVYNVGIFFNYDNVISTGVTKVIPSVTVVEPALPISFNTTDTIAQYGISTTSTQSGNVNIGFVLPSSINTSVFNSITIFGTNSSGVTTQISSSFLSTTGLIAGMAISGSSIASGTTISSVSTINNQINLSNPAISTTSGLLNAFPSTPFVGSSISGSSDIQNVSTTSGLFAGMSITGSGISSGTTIVSVNPSLSQVTLSQPTTITNNNFSPTLLPITFNGSTVSGSSQVSNIVSNSINNNNRIIYGSIPGSYLGNDLYNIFIIPSGSGTSSSIPSPTNLSGVSLTGGVYLSWSMSSNVKINDYIIKYSSDSGVTWKTYPHIPSTSPFVTVRMKT
jgi:formylglycine-generating enzyme required for sulfatase activity